MKILIYYVTAWLVNVGCSRKMATEVPLPSADTSSISSSSGNNKTALMPECLQKKIDSIKQQPVSNPPTEIHKYDYKGATVYLFSANCCDGFNAAFDENCNYICAPSGGFTGKGDGKCNDFDEQAKLVTLVWKDARERK
jgi:hypothetical protein